ncbi:MAG: V-type ATP synthase subunit E [Treponema sp.]|jgi:V/A-type H+-transporting ATPase subunit E|nr:V-type ATP synthase subunit E [Treponema sp.]
MDIQLQELIDKIKKDGVESASAEAAKVKTNAEAEAKRIVEAAQKEAAGITTKAKAEAERLEKAGAATLAQASRNLLLAFQGEIQALLDKIVLKDVSDAFNEDALKQTLPEILKAWASKGSDSLDVLLSEEDLKKTRAFFDRELADVLKKGVELKSDRNLSAGFRIANKDGSAYYDFSATAAAEMLSAYLNPRLTEILKTAAKG